MPFGRLERTPAAPPMSEINMTPLVDVMLVLVVICLITAPLLVKAVKVDLPTTQGALAVPAPHAIVLTLDRTGEVSMDGLVLSASALAAQLHRAALHHPDTEIALHADAEVPYGRVVELMGVAHQAGLHRVGFAAHAPGTAQPASAPVH